VLARAGNEQLGGAALRLRWVWFIGIEVGQSQQLGVSSNWRGGKEW